MVLRYRLAVRGLNSTLRTWGAGPLPPAAGSCSAGRRNRDGARFRLRRRASRSAPLPGEADRAGADVWCRHGPRAAAVVGRFLVAGPAGHHCPGRSRYSAARQLVLRGNQHDVFRAGRGPRRVPAAGHGSAVLAVPGAGDGRHRGHRRYRRLGPSHVPGARAASVRAGTGDLRGLVRPG